MKGRYKLMGIDKRKKYYVVLDTETCPIDKTIQEVKPENMFTYDIGWAIIDKKGTVYESYSFLVKEIFTDENDLMQSAYYANKIPQYLVDVANGTRTVESWVNIRKALIESMQKYNTNIVMCHNARFDDVTMKITTRWLSKSKYRYFLPYGTVVWDTLKMASDTIGKQKTYRRFCEQNGYMTSHKTPRPRLTAEILYRYISGDNDFEENHTGLEDVMIEKEIFAKCMRQHKKMRKELYAN